MNNAMSDNRQQNSGVCLIDIGDFYDHKGKTMAAEDGWDAVPLRLFSSSFGKYAQTSCKPRWSCRVGWCRSFTDLVWSRCIFEQTYFVLKIVVVVVTEGCCCCCCCMCHLIYHSTTFHLPFDCFEEG